MKNTLQQKQFKWKKGSTLLIFGESEIPKIFTFRQHRTTGFIQRRWDYFSFLINYKILLKTDILAAFTSDHSPLIFTLSTNQDKERGKAQWKFNNSLALNSDFVDKMKAHITNTQKSLDQENIKEDKAR